jgi:hypothetical protein
LFAILAANGLALKLEKCLFAVSDFLGYRVSAAGVALLWDNVQVILDFPKPADCKSLEKFFGYDEFLPPFPPRHCRHPPSAHSRTLR